MARRPWTPDELAWAHECAAAGDTFEEIGADLDCPDPREVQARLGVAKRMVRSQSEVAELFAAGLSGAEIDGVRGLNPRNSSAAHTLRRIRKLGYQLRTPESELRRAAVERRLDRGSTTQLAVADAVGLSLRQVQRISRSMRPGRAEGDFRA